MLGIHCHVIEAGLRRDGKKLAADKAVMAKRASIKLHPGRGGWIHTTIAPIQDKREARFGLMDIAMFVSLTIGLVAIARLLIAH